MELKTWTMREQFSDLRGVGTMSSENCPFYRKRLSYYKILFMFLKFFGPISNLVSCFGSEVFSQRVPMT